MVLLIACGLVAATAPGRAGGSLAALSQAPEWNQLALLWQAMLDHSSDLVYSPARFQDLAKDMDSLDAQAAALAKRSLLAEGMARDLTRLFHGRYLYIGTYHYITQSHLSQTDAEAALSTAHWIVELQLSAVRRAAAGGQQDRAATSAAESNIAYELAFLAEYERFEAEAQKRKQELLNQQAAGKEVNLPAFESDCERRRNLLLGAYRERRLRPPRAVRALLPYLISLTTHTPASGPAAASAASGP